MLLAVSFGLISIVFGIVGYMLIEKYGFLEAFYMTVITISTVGFTEVMPLSPAGRIFTIIFIIINLVIFAYVISVLTSYLFEGNLKKIFRKYMTDRELSKLKGHVIVCGLGRNGSKACEELIRSNKRFVVIDKQPEIPDIYPEAVLQNFIPGDATTDEILTRAQVHKASYVITTLPKDADNVYITLTARGLNPQVTIIARASEESSAKKLYRAGADKVIIPETLGGMHMAQIVTKPDVVEFLEMLNGVTELKLDLEEFPFDDLKEEYKNKTIRELDIRQKTGVTVLAYKDLNQGFLFDPGADLKITEQGILIVLGSEKGITQFKKIFINGKTDFIT